MNILVVYIILQTQAGIDRHFTEYLNCFSSSFILKMGKKGNVF